jgi:UDP-glucose:(heptosyl)LPS alpha-1,3-glucosyltransferase
VEASSLIMRIGIVIEEFDPARGGMEQWCRQFVSALGQQGHELHLVSQRFGEMTLPGRVERHLLPRANSRMDFAEYAARQVRSLELDVVHDMGAGWCCDVFQPHGGSHCAWLARRFDMYPALYGAIKRSVDGWLPRQRDYMRRCRRQFERSEQTGKTFIALANIVADDFIRFHQVRPEQIAVVYNGVDCKRYTPDHRAVHRVAARQMLGVEDATVLLLLATHNFRLKGVPELLNTAARLVANGRPVHVAIVGRGRLSHWRRVAARLAVSDHTTFVGEVNNMIPYYAAADAYVHPTYYDQCSLVILEAAASGLPIVTSRRHHGTAEMFREGDEILTVYDPRDADDLYERVEALFDEGVRTKLGIGARQAAERHPFERNVAEILGLYERHVQLSFAA